jgi:putative peptide zinc metalloprotease protein
MWWLVLLVLLLALTLTVVNFMPGPAWAEMPSDRALLTADHGPLQVLIDGSTTTLDEGGRRYVDAGSRIEVPDGSGARLTFPGGSAVLLCAGSRTQVGRLWTDNGQHRAPHGVVTIDSGRMLADTTSTSGAFQPLSLTVRRPLGDVRNTGRSWYAVDPSAVTLSTGSVTVGGAPTAASGTALNCGDGVAVPPPTAGPSEEPSDEPTSDLPSDPTPSASASIPAPATNAPTTIPVPGQPADPTTVKPPPTTKAPTTPPTTKASPSPSRSTTSPRPSSPPPPTNPSSLPDNPSSPPVIIG